MSAGQIARVSTLEELQALADEWDALLAAAQIENVFLTHMWLSEWWRVYGPGRDLWVLIARGKDGLEGAAPFMLERAPNNVRRLLFLGDFDVTPNHLDVIALPEARANFILDVCQFLEDARSQWDLLELDGFPEGTPTLNLICDALRSEGHTVDTHLTSVCPYAALPPSFEAYLQSRGAKTRKQLRANQRWLARDFPSVRFGRVESLSELDAVFDAMVCLHQARWTARGQPGSFSTQRFTVFHRAVAHQALAHGRLRLYFLQIGDSFAAIYYCFRIGQHVAYYNAGFDERWGKYSVGTQLLAYAVEQSVAEGAREFDFLQGDEEYKSHWATHSRGNWRLRAASGHWRGRLVWARLKLREAMRHR